MADTSRLEELYELSHRASELRLAMWRCHTVLEKRQGDWTPEQIDSGEASDPYEVIESDFNILTYGGASALWSRLIGDTSVPAFSSANARIGVGNGTAAESATQTDLQGASTLRKAMDGGYPQHTDGTGSENASIAFRATFGPDEANFAWEEWGIFNAASGGRMLNRRRQSQGTKNSGSTWTLTVTLTLA